MFGPAVEDIRLAQVRRLIHVATLKPQHRLQDHRAGFPEVRFTVAEPEFLGSDRFQPAVGAQQEGLDQEFTDFVAVTARVAD